jgi:hypothetical protein
VDRWRVTDPCLHNQHKLIVITCSPAIAASPATGTIRRRATKLDDVIVGALAERTESPMR